MRRVLIGLFFLLPIAAMAVEPPERGAGPDRHVVSLRDFSYTVDVDGRSEQVWVKSPGTNLWYIPAAKQLAGGSGFIVSKTGKFYLVTCGHVAKGLFGSTCQMGIRSESGGRDYFWASTCQRAASSPMPHPDAKLDWAYSVAADVAATEIPVPSDEIGAALAAVAIPFAQLVSDKGNAVEEGDELKIWGFPMIVKPDPGKEMKLSSLGVSAISGLTTVRDGLEREQRGYFISQPVHIGFSGSPAFRRTTNSVSMCGVAAGSMPSYPGLYLGVVVWSQYVVDLLSQMTGSAAP